MLSKSFVIFFVGCCCISCIGQTKVGEMGKKYKIPYIAEGNHPNLYKDLQKSDLEDLNIQKIVHYAKLVARDSGYEITGEKFETFIYNEQRYPIKFIVYENLNYYLVQLIPQGISRTSLDLKISIDKLNNEVIAILKGS